MTHSYRIKKRAAGSGNGPETTKSPDGGFPFNGPPRRTAIFTGRQRLLLSRRSLAKWAGCHTSAERQISIYSARTPIALKHERAADPVDFVKLWNLDSNSQPVSISMM